MNNNLVIPKLLLLTSMIGTTNCMETGSLVPSQKISSRFERQEDFIARTEKLPAMFNYKAPEYHGPKIQFNALNKRGVQLYSVIDHDTRQPIARRIDILFEDRTSVLKRWEFKSNDVVAAAISCDENMLATVHECSGGLFWNLWKISSGILKSLNRIGEKRKIVDSDWKGSDIMPESIDFNKQGDAVIIWGVTMTRALTPRQYKIYSLSGVNEDKVVETIQ